MHIYVGEQLTEDDNNDNNKAKDKSLLHRPILTESNEPIAENVLLPAISEIRYSLNRNFWTSDNLSKIGIIATLAKFFEKAVHE